MDARRWTGWLIAAAAWALWAAGAARAQQVVVLGGADSSNAFPFGSGDYRGEYQQVYTGAAFSAPSLITQIAFAQDPVFGGGTVAYNLSIGLGTTSASPSDPGASYAGNRGPDFTTVFSGSYSATFTAAPSRN
jgi:hypothetical protein